MPAPAETDARLSVLFLCTHNSARSQLAEGLLRARHGDRFQAFSAGTVARGVHPGAAAALRDAGIDPSGQASKTIDDLGDRAFDIVVTVCDNAREACPYLPGRLRTLHRGFRDPSAAPPAEQAATFAAVRDEIAHWLDLTFGTAPVPATADDWPGILGLLRQARLPKADLDPAHADRFLVIRDGDQIIGSVAVEPYGDAGLLRSLAVAEGARGSGLGHALADAAEARARAEGLAELYLLTTTAAPFFASRGWAPVDRADMPGGVRASTEFQGTCPASAVCLRKALSR